MKELGSICSLYVKHMLQWGFFFIGGGGGVREENHQWIGTLCDAMVFDMKDSAMKIPICTL
jgi:hypothetical protein